MYCCADKPTIVLVDPCCNRPRTGHSCRYLAEFHAFVRTGAFITWETLLEPLKLCIGAVWAIMGYSYIAKRIYLIASKVCVWLIFVVLWFIQVALLGSVAAMARWLGTELLELTATDNGRGPSWKTLVIPLSFQAFSPSLVTFGLAFANPSPQPFADPQVLASSWTTCRETAIWSQKQTATTHSISFSFGMISCSDEKCEGKWSMLKWAWLHFDTLTLLHGFRLSLGFKEHLSCIDVLPVGIHTAAFKNPKGFLPANRTTALQAWKRKEFPDASWFFRWLRTGAPGSDSVSTSCEEFANMYCPKVSGKRGIIFMVFACFCSSFQTFLKSFSSFIVHWLYLLLLWGLAEATASRLESVHAGNVVWLLRFRE